MLAVCLNNSHENFYSLKISNSEILLIFETSYLSLAKKRIFLFARDY